MSSAHLAAHARPAHVRRAPGRHRKPSRAHVVVPTGVTGGLLMVSVATGLATAAPASANDGGAAATTSSSSVTHSAYRPASSSQPMLLMGSHGQAVEAVQRKVGATVDGVFGPETRAAVMRFQRDHGLLVDGIVGPRTWAAFGGTTSSDSSDGGRTTPASYDTSGSASSLGAKVIAAAAALEGAPYAYGAEGPDAFDCSGLVQYVFGQLGYSLPRTTQDQYDAVQHVSRDDLRVGDLVFLADSSGYMYHVGIYAGDGSWWVARHTGTTVTKQQAYWMNGGYDWRVGRVG